LLDGFTPRKGFAIEEWLSQERERFRSNALFAMGQVLSWALDRGAVDDARRVAMRMLAIDPTEETAHRGLMHVYATQRRFSLALRQFNLCKQILDTELGVEPDVQTRHLHAQIVRCRSVAVVYSSAGSLPLGSEGRH
jgi:DNA-binding SARP family transcriptional activator